MPRKEKETTSQMVRREMAEKLRKIKTPPGWAKFKKEVMAELKKGKKKEKKKTPDTVRTKDTQFQLKEAGVKFKTDRQKVEEKRKKSK